MMGGRARGARNDLATVPPGEGTIAPSQTPPTHKSPTRGRGSPRPPTLTTSPQAHGADGTSSGVFDMGSPPLLGGGDIKELRELRNARRASLQMKLSIRPS